MKTHLIRAEHSAPDNQISFRYRLLLRALKGLSYWQKWQQRSQCGSVSLKAFQSNWFCLVSRDLVHLVNPELLKTMTHSNGSSEGGGMNRSQIKAEIESIGIRAFLGEVVNALGEVAISSGDLLAEYFAGEIEDLIELEAATELGVHEDDQSLGEEIDSSMLRSPD